MIKVKTKDEDEEQGSDVERVTNKKEKYLYIIR